MPLDAICLEAVLCELREQLINARIDKVYQPERDEIGLAVRTPSHGNMRLLISVNPSHCRIHITRRTRENPSKPPMFCMLLRKHLTGARINEIVQPPGERVVQIVTDAVNEIGERVKRVLTAELMGRNSNLILVDEHNRIVDCLRRVDHEMSERRPVLPGLFYSLPPAQDKSDPADSAAWRSRLENTRLSGPVDKWICGNVSGISPLVAREICFGAFGQTSARFEEVHDREPLWREITRFIELVRSKRYVPFLLREDAKPKEFSYMPILQYGGLYTPDKADGFSELLDCFFTERDMLEHRQKRASGLRKTVQNALDRTRRKLVVQAEELESTKNRERLREYGDLLMANLNNIKRGESTAKVCDFYHPDQVLTEIPLNVSLSPQQNAAKYYKQYTKAKNAQEMLKTHITQGSIDIEYLESVLDAIERASGEAELSEIRDELAACGFMPAAKVVKKTAVKPSKPYIFKSSSGMYIYAGRNNKQNDTLTLKTADKSDVWLHVQKIPGSHVVIDCRGEQPDDITLEQAAILAATYSQAHNAQKVPVDYTQVRYVKKMAGGKPGMVIYDRFRTVFVNPDTALAETLKI